MAKTTTIKNLKKKIKAASHSINISLRMSQKTREFS